MGCFLCPGAQEPTGSQDRLRRFQGGPCLPVPVTLGPDNPGKRATGVPSVGMTGIDVGILRPFFSPLSPSCSCVGCGPGPHVGGLPGFRVCAQNYLQQCCFTIPEPPKGQPLTADRHFLSFKAWLQAQAIALSSDKRTKSTSRVQLISKLEVWEQLRLP